MFDKDYVAGLEAALEFYASKTVDGITFSGGDDDGKRARAALSARPDAPDVRMLTVAQLERWIAYTTEHGGAANCLKEIRAIIGEMK